MNKSPEYIEARGKAIKYIMYKLRTSFEVRNKLFDLGFDERIISQVICDLIELQYINDEDFTKKFIESNKKSKKISKSMIKLKLKNKGIDGEIIEKYFSEIEFDDIDAIKKLLVKKKFSNELEYDEKNKIIAYCVRKGFNMNDVIRAIKDM